MANLTIKQCGNCNQRVDELWIKQDGQGRQVCPYCGVVNVFSSNEEDIRLNERLRDIYIYLDNLQFDSACEQLKHLKEKYPKSSQVYFLYVLAENRVCYTEDGNDSKKRIPTLNDLPEKSLLETDLAKKALELAESELVRKTYEETFNYIEKIRLEILEAASKKENQYDIFISTKVTLIDENNHEVLDGMGKPKESPDCAFARQLYNEISERFKGKKVFFSQSSEAKDKMAGQKYENIIYSALHSSKVFILVAETRQNVEWRWVRNEWMRYLRIMRNDPENHHYVLITHHLKENDLPNELRKRQNIDYDSVSAYRQLEAFLEKSLNSGKTSTKLEAKTFDDTVEKIELGNIEQEITTRQLKTRVEQTSEDVKAEIELYERDLDPKSPYRREEAFKNLEELLQREPDTYEAKKLLLLRGTDYYHFEDYIDNPSEIIKNSSIAAKFLEFAEEKEAKQVINDVLRQLDIDINEINLDDPDDAGIFDDNFPEYASCVGATLSSIIIPYLDAIDKKLLKELCLDDFVDVVISFDLEEMESIVESYLYIQNYKNNRDPQKYIDDRFVLLKTTKSYFDNDGYAKLEDKLVNEILKVNPAHYQTLWFDFCFKTFKDYYEPLDSVNPYKLVDDIENGKKTVSIVWNKEVLETFKTIFKYSRGEERKWFMFVFLVAIIHDQGSYKKEEGMETLLLSKDTDHNNEIDDYELNGFDLFKQYIVYELPNINFKSTAKTELKENSPLLSPNGQAFLKKEKPTVLDKLICNFAVKMHKAGFFEQAIDLYDLYLGQQESEKVFHCLLIRFYRELANVRIVEPNELKRINRELQHKSIDLDIMKLEKTDPQATVLYNKIRDIIDIQQQYLRTCEPIKTLVGRMPREKTIDKIKLLAGIKKGLDWGLANVAPEVRKDMEQDFAYEIDYFNNQYPELLEAEKLINDLPKVEEKVKELIAKRGKDFCDKCVERIEALEALSEVVKDYDDPSHREEHINKIKKLIAALKAAEKKYNPKKRRKRIFATASIIVSLIVVAALALSFFVINPFFSQKNYEDGVRSLNNGDYQTAAKKLENCSYKDAKNQYKMAKAGLSFQEGNYNEGIENVCAAGGSTDVKYDPDGGTFAKTKETITTYAPISTNCNKDYYTFAEWKVQDFTIKTEENSYKATLSLKASFNLTEYTITYVLNGGENDSRNPSTYTYETDNITLRAPTKKGHTFVNWTNDGNPVTSIPKHSHGDITLTANWSINTYTVTLISNDESKGTVSGSGTFNYHSSIVAQASPKSSCLFKGWFSDSEMRNKVSDNATYSFTLEDEDVTLYAKFLTQEENQWELDHAVVPTIYYDYLDYGLYPQSLVDNNTLIHALNDLDYSARNSVGWYLYNNEYYVQRTATPNKTTYEFINGVTIQSGSTYWFKCEPIQWDILTTSSNEYYLLSTLVLDCHCYFPNESNRTIGGKTVYPNNYKYSAVRAFLNGYDASSYGDSDYMYYNFYDQAFYLDASYVLTTEVDNSASTTTTDTNPYACENTQDKVFLPSYQDYINTSYGFTSSQDSTYTRGSNTTDYARACGVVCSMNSSSYYFAPYWMRSPQKSDPTHAIYNNSDGHMYGTSVTETIAGIRPAIKIKL